MLPLEWIWSRINDLPHLECGVWFHILLFLAVALHCFLRPRDPRSTLSWLLTTAALPVFGALLYLVFGINRVREKGWQKYRSDETFGTNRDRHERDAHPLAYWRGIRTSVLAEPSGVGARDLDTFLDRLAGNHPLLEGNAIQTLVDAREAYPAMFAAIRAARRHIHLQSYIIGDDETGRELLDALAERASAGVQVRVLYDKFGSARARFRRFFRKYAKRPNMKIVGFTQVHLFRRQFQLNLRNHRKILVVDGRIGFTGGMNFYDAYRATPGRHATHDYHFQIEGPTVLELQYSFLRDWYYMTDEPAERLLDPAHFPCPDRAGNTPIRLLNSGPTTAECETLPDALFAAITGARRQVLIVTPYFVPPEDLQRALRCAALRGVDVKVLLPARNNHAYVGYASRALYEGLLESGVRVFELPSPFLHAKSMLVDDVIAFVGSANFDARSLRLNYETSLVVMDERFVSELKRVVLADLAQADEVPLAVWRRRPVHQRILESFCSLLSPVA
jgi:cardiolipin synthase